MTDERKLKSLHEIEQEQLLAFVENVLNANKMKYAPGTKGRLSYEGGIGVAQACSRNPIKRWWGNRKRLRYSKKLVELERKA